jgi:hypothetical protein
MTAAQLQRLGHARGSRALDRARRLLVDVRTAATMPRVEVVVSRGTPEEEQLLREFREPHPRYRVVGRKVVGVALLALDEFDDLEGYLKGLRYARRRVRRARRLGYRIALFDPAQQHADLQEIHASLPERQGRPMDPSYFEPDRAYESGPHVEYVGVLRDGAVVGYCELLHAGDVVSTNRIMGHGEHLADGIMFLLMAGIVEHVKRARPSCRYVYYDTFFGAGDGLRAFKANLGFRPYWVRWKREGERRRRW